MSRLRLILIISMCNAAHKFPNALPSEHQRRVLLQVANLVAPLLKFLTDAGMHGYIFLHNIAIENTQNLKIARTAR